MSLTVLSGICGGDAVLRHTQAQEGGGHALPRFTCMCLGESVQSVYIHCLAVQDSNSLAMCVCSLVQSAVYRRFKHGRNPEKKHWLQYASPKFSVSPVYMHVTVHVQYNMCICTCICSTLYMSVC